MRAVNNKKMGSIHELRNTKITRHNQRGRILETIFLLCIWPIFIFYLHWKVFHKAHSEFEIFIPFSSILNMSNFSLSFSPFHLYPKRKGHCYTTRKTQINNQLKWKKSRALWFRDQNHDRNESIYFIVPLSLFYCRIKFIPSLFFHKFTIIGIHRFLKISYHFHHNQTSLLFIFSHLLLSFLSLSPQPNSVK